MPYYNFNRPGAKVSEDVREDYWRQGQATGILAAYRAITAFSETDFREAGTPTSPTILLLHGFPSSSHRFRTLIPKLKDPEHTRVMTSLQLDISSNFAHYPIWQAYLSRHQPRTPVRGRGRHCSTDRPHFRNRQKEPMMGMIEFARPDGQMLQGYLAEPDRPTNAPAVIVIQEWWGLNQQIRGVADRLAHAGYIALVPDLYRGKSTVEQEEAHHLMEGLDFADAARQDIGGAIQYLKARAAKVGCMGFCMGGALTLLAANMHADLDAAVTFYGFPPLEFIDPSRMAMPLQGHWATQDQHFDIATVGELEKRLVETGAKIEFYRYLASHAFANEEAVGSGRMATSQYDPVWAQQAWDRTLTFFGRYLAA